MISQPNDLLIMIKKILIFFVAAGLLSTSHVIAQGYGSDLSDADLKLEETLENFKDHEIAVLRFRVDNRLRTVAFVLFGDDVPKTCENFATKCREGYYDGLAFHRAIPGFLLQTGDPLTRDASQRSTWGTGGPDHTVPAEKGKKIHSKGAVAMARLSPEGPSHGSQFYFSMGKNRGLNGQSTVFGKVVSGMDALQRLSEVAVDAYDNPIVEVEIKSARILEPGSQIPKTADELKLSKERKREQRRERANVSESEKSSLDRLLEKYW